MNITDFSRAGYKYDSDRGEEHTIQMRVVYASLSGLTAGAGANGPIPVTMKPRHLWIAGREGNKLIRRKFPCSKSQADAAVLGAAAATVDGVAFIYSGYVGEKCRGVGINP